MASGAPPPTTAARTRLLVQARVAAVARTPIAPRAASLALFVERYVLSLFFLYYAAHQIEPIRTQVAALARSGPLLDAVTFPSLVKFVLLFLLNVLVGVLLLVSRRPAVPPTTREDVLVPLVANFFYLAYNFVDLAPPGLARNLFPSSWRLPLSLAALDLGVLALALAVWAVAHLGRSFAILVSVRPVVLSGPYRFVRHPMYVGYILVMIGLVVALGSILVLLLTAIHILLTVWRARLEEARLSAHSPEYRAYVRQTGFLLPRLG
jgi:protein-S-isoprenylcysteine O-methyltransferase Ste14